MGFLSGHRNKSKLVPEHKFEYINLRDFQDKSFVNVTAYIWIYLSILISLSCVAADTYTAITLLVFNRWSGLIQPVIPLETAKFIFAACILISYALIIYDWIFAVLIIRSGGVAGAYMNVIALRWNSVRGGKGKDDTGWKRFLVFARLTKKRGKTEYVALITYFSFKGWVRVIFAEGPRVLVNAFTLASVVTANIPTNKVEGHSAISMFFENIQHLYSENKIQVLVLCSMAFTTILWIFSILQLLLACTLFITFLWHVIGSDSLRKYCKDRIDKRMGEIVLENHKKIIQKDNRVKTQAGILRAPTIPAVALVENSSNSPSSLRMQQLPRKPTLSNLADMEDRRGNTLETLHRIQTSGSTTSSFRPSMDRSQGNMLNSPSDSTVSLVPAQANMGYGGQEFQRGVQKSLESTERQQQVQRQWGSPPSNPALASPYEHAVNTSGRNKDSRTPAQEYAGRNKGRRTPAPKDGYQVQDVHSPLPPSQSGRGPFAADRLGRQQRQDGCAGQGQYQGQSGQYPRRPSPGRSGSGRSGYGPAQERFPVSVRSWEQQQQYYSGSPRGQVQSPQDYYPPQQQAPPRQRTPHQQPQGPPQPYLYEYIPPQQQEKLQSQLPQLNTQVPSPTTGGGYKRPTYTPASTTTNNPSQGFYEPQAGYFPGRKGPVQTRSVTTPPVRAIRQPQRSATARPDLGI